MMLISLFYICLYLYIFTAYYCLQVRFFYCHTGSSTFQLMLESGQRKDVLWTPPKTSGAAPCAWQKAAAVIPHQTREYRLKLAFGKLYKQPLSVALDFFSMTPDCFVDGELLKASLATNRLVFTEHFEI